MKVKLNNGRFPEDGSVVVSLPIETEEYDQVIRQLDRLGVGSACLRDCGFEALLEGPDVMNRLAGGKVNIEELDYLAKRLDSFTASELATYSALALKYDLTDMTDLINLCDCFQNALIVTDFSDMSRIGQSSPVRRRMVGAKASSSGRSRSVTARNCMCISGASTTGRFRPRRSASDKRIAREG